MKLPKGVEVLGPMQPGYEKILTPAALDFVAKLVRKHGKRRAELLELRKQRQQPIDKGRMPGFLKETAKIRKAKWQIAGIPADLQDRRVEITGPVDRKMIINALNSGAKCFMADFEDSQSPTWDGLVTGQINLKDAVRRSISFTSPEGKQYALADKTATLIVRPRGWHLLEKHVWIDGQPISGSI